MLFPEYDILSFSITNDWLELEIDKNKSSKKNM